MPAPDRLRGTIIRRIVDRGFGFIRAAATKEEFFFHKDDLENCEFAHLSDGDTLSFKPKATPKGPRAEEVRRVCSAVRVGGTSGDR